MHIEMGDDKKYSVTGLGTVTFQREHWDPLTLKSVTYVTGVISKSDPGRLQTRKTSSNCFKPTLG